MTRLQPEAQIQRAVIEHLRRRGVAGSFAFHPANGGWRTAIEGAILKGMGVAAGVPDVIIISGGKVFGLELKVNNGRLTDIQRETIPISQFPRCQPWFRSGRCVPSANAPAFSVTPQLCRNALAAGGIATKAMPHRAA
jgi:hypothetical protein